ncbi:MAG: SurA N-terminal domain-containing protein [Deltaproteobacteria bacterium]|jgi:peptidyl-prolyl cis-trans isomerase D|nr:SurA N-terminal domain-containing protein [Deltaproteobacteria bacterium]
MLDVIRRKSQSLFVKIIFGVIILVFVFWGASAVDDTRSAQTMAKVNDTEITVMDFRLVYGRQLGTLRALPGFTSLTSEQEEELGQYVLQQMISREILRQEAIRLGLGTSDNELSYIVAKTPQFAAADGKFNRDRYKAVLESANMTPGMYERDVSNEIMEFKFRNYIGASISLSPEEARRSFQFDYQRRIVDYVLFPAADYIARVQPEEQEIADYYEANKDAFAIPAMADFDYLLFNAAKLSDSLSFTEEELQAYYESHADSFRQPDLYRIRHIMLATPAGAADDDPRVKEALDKAGAARKEITTGVSFAAAAQQYSQDVQTRSSGGDLGWLEKGQTEPAFEEAFLALQPGETSEPVRTSYGFHILQVEEVKPARQKSFAEVEDEIAALKKEDAIFQRMEDIQQEVEDSLLTQKDLDALGQRYNMAIERTGLKDIGALAELLGVQAGAFADLASVQPGTVLPTPMNLGDGFLALKLNAYVPGSIPQMQSVLPEITEKLRERGAFKLAMDEAGKVAEEITSSGGALPAEISGRVTESKAADRSAGLVELGFSPMLTQAVFTEQPGQWVGTPFSVDTGAVLIKVKEAVDPAASEWEERSASYTGQLLEDRRNLLLNAYFGLVVRDSEINILVDKIFRN